MRADIGMIGKRRGKQRLGVGMQRMIEELLRFRHLHQPAEIHDDDHLAHVADGTEVVRDEEIAEALLLPQVFQQVHDLRADRDIERRDRLIEHDELR